MEAEIKRLEQALADTEALWRQERDKNRDLIANEWRDCENCRKVLCVIPCPAGERVQSRMDAAMEGEA